MATIDREDYDGQGNITPGSGKRTLAETLQEIADDLDVLRSATGVDVSVIKTKKGRPTQRTAGDPPAQMPVTSANVSNSVADLRLRVGTPSDRFACTLGYYAAGDGGGGDFWADHSDTTSADNGGTILVDAGGVRWKLFTPHGEVSVLQWGAKGDGTTDDQPAIQAAVDYVRSNTTQVDTLKFPTGKTYLVSDTIVIANQVAGEYNTTGGFRLAGHETRVSIVGSRPVIKVQTGDRPILAMQNVRAVTIEGIDFTGLNVISSQLPTLQDYLVDANFVKSGIRSDTNSPHCGIAIDPYFRSGIGDTSNGSAVITNVLSAVNFSDGDTITGDGIPASTTVVSTTADTITMSANATATATGVTLHNPRIEYPGQEGRYTNTGIGGTRTCVIKGCAFRDLVVGLMLNSSTGVAQGEDIDVENCEWEWVQDCVGIGQAQSRFVQLRNCRFAFCRSVANGVAWGDGLGVLPSIMGGGVVFCQTMLAGTMTRGNSAVSNFFGEAVLTIGALYDGGSTVDFSASFQGCHFKLADVKGLPDFHLLVGGPCTFDGCTIQNTGSGDFPFIFYIASTDGGPEIVFTSCHFGQIPSSAPIVSNMFHKLRFEGCILYNDNDPMAGGLLSMHRVETTRPHIAEDPLDNWKFLASTYAVPGSRVTAGGLTYQTGPKPTLCDVVASTVDTIDQVARTMLINIPSTVIGFLRVGDPIVNSGNASWLAATVAGGAPGAQGFVDTYLGIITDVDTINNQILVSYPPESKKDQWLGSHALILPKFHIPTRGDTTVSSTTISNVSPNPVDHWAVGDRIKSDPNAMGLGVYVTAVSASTITLSQGASGTQTQALLFDAELRPLSRKDLGEKTVGTTEVTVAHSLGYRPSIVEITMTSAGQIYKSSASDQTNIYLTADAASRTAEIRVA